MAGQLTLGGEFALELRTRPLKPPVRTTGRRSPIGSAAEAELARRGELRAIGEGAFRRVYLSRDGRTVYKVHTRRSVANVDEFYAIDELRGTYGIPPATLYGTGHSAIIAMHYYPYDRDDLESARREALWQRPSSSRRIAKFESLRELFRDAYNSWMAAGIGDLHSGNYRFDRHYRPFVTDLNINENVSDAWNCHCSACECDDDE